MNNFSTKDSSITSSKVCFVKGPSTAHHTSKLTITVTCTLNPITPNPFASFEHSGRAIPVKDGVSVSRGNLGAFKQGESYGIDLCISGFNLMYLISGQAVTFGSIENSSAPIPSSTITPVVKPEGIKSFGTVAVNLPSGYVSGKASISSRPHVFKGEFKRKETFSKPSGDNCFIAFRYVIPHCAKHESGTTLVVTSLTTAPPSQLGPHQYSYSEGSGAYGCLFLSDEEADEKPSRYSPYAVHASSLCISLFSVFMSDEI
jgi:hypothetical protein